ncbi:MAG: amidase [Microvirga sp.]|nr:amidase [Microvirga sp.]
MSELHRLSLAEAGAALRTGAVSSVELTEATLARVAALDPGLHLFFLVTAERAMSDARRADAELRSGIDRGPMHGIPYGLKDILDTEGVPTTCNSRLFIDHVPERDSAVEARLRDGGGVLLGKLSTSEFACGGPAEDVLFPVSKNPWDTRHYTGGSSSGSAGAVAAGFMRVAIGTDTGGSTRVPASYCGVVGLKPTYGLISTRGLFPLAPTLDHCAPLSKSVHDMALLLNVVAGFDPGDPASVSRPPEDYARHIGEPIAGARLGYARQFLLEAGILPELLARLDESVETLRGLGATVEEISIPDFELFRACSRLIVSAEAFAIHEATLISRPRDYGSLAYARLVAGAALSGGDLIQASRLRRELVLAIGDILDRYDALVTSTAWGQAPALAASAAAPPPPMIGSPTIIASLTGNPAISVPIGLSKAGLPFGMQMLGRHFGEARLLQIAAALEKAVGFTGSDLGEPPLDRVRAAPVAS